MGRGHVWIMASLAWAVAQSPGLAAGVFVALAVADLTGHTVAVSSFNKCNIFLQADWSTG